MASIAHPTLAIVKYWGFEDEDLFLPKNPSVAVTLDGFWCKVWLEESPSGKDEFFVNGERLAGEKLRKPLKLVNFARKRWDIPPIRVLAESNIPMGTGIASSGAAMAALARELNEEFGLGLNEKELSCLARVGSGSAARSVPGHYNEWIYGRTHEESYARILLRNSEWKELRVVTFIVSKSHKKVSSYQGHKKANTSAFNHARVLEAWKDWWIAREAIKRKDLITVGEIAEKEALNLQAVAMGTGVVYFEPETVKIMREIWKLREQEIPAYFTLDAGPTVHVITLNEFVSRVLALSKVEKVVSSCGEGVREA